MVERGGVVVTGAGGGIGAEVARCLGGAGYGVVANDLGVGIDGASADGAVVRGVVATIRARGGRAVGHQHDVASFEAARDLVQLAVDVYGRLEAVVTCHGTGRERMIFDMTEDEWDSVIAVHLTGAFNCVRFAAEHMREQRGGSIVLVGSPAGWEGGPAQAGVLGLAASTALAMGGHDVNVNTVIPAGPEPPELAAALVRALIDPDNRHVTGQTFTAADHRLARWAPPEERESVRLDGEFAYADVTAAVRDRLGLSTCTAGQR